MATKTKRRTADVSAAAVVTESKDDAINVIIRGVRMDLMVVRAICEQIEQAHNLPSREYRMTPQFLLDLANAMIENGVPGCTPTDAWLAWHESWEKYAELKKKRQETQT